MTNLYSEELSNLFQECSEFVNNERSPGREKRIHHTMFDILFMLLMVFKAGGSWYHLASLCKIITVTFQWPADKFVIIFHKWAFKHLVKNVRNYNYMKWNMCEKMVSNFGFIQKQNMQRM